MKKKLGLFIGIGVMSAVMLSGCWSSGEGNEASTENVVAETEAVTEAVAEADVVQTEAVTEAVEVKDTSAGNLGDYYVSIGDCRMGKDYEGNPTVIVSYEFTNNSSESAAFMSSIDAIVFQNGVQCNTSVSSDYDSMSSINQVQSGGKTTVELSYSLKDTTSPISVEVSELFSFTDEKLTKNFNLA